MGSSVCDYVCTQECKERAADPTPGILAKAGIGGDAFS